MHSVSKLITLFTLITLGHTNADIQLASPFTDHAVLQQGMEVPVWGWADPDTKITVQFGNQTKETVTSAQGEWKIKLDSLKSSFDATTLTVSSSDGDTITLEDILVGEVWICSGQSNMQMPLKAVPELASLAPEASHIRNFTVNNMVSFDEEKTCEGEWVATNPNSAVAFGFAYFLQKSADVPIGIILTSWGSSSLEAWMPREMTESVPHFKTIMEEFDADLKTQETINTALSKEEKWTKQEDIFMRRQPNILYNAMMHPLVGYACRGLVWYQGERNTQSMHGMVTKPWFFRNSGMLLYANSLKEWIKYYRKSWQKDDMEFLVVMLPGYGKTHNTHEEKSPIHPAAHSWAWMRESQLAALDLPHTAVANTIDLGDLKDVHPKDKLPIGQRLALLAQRDTLGQDIVAQGPVFKEISQQGDSLLVSFTHAEGLTTTNGEAPSGFWIADDSQNWVPADAVITGQSIKLSSTEIKKPLYVLYAFAGKPDVNLVNAADLPAYPFRTDTFKP